MPASPRKPFVLRTEGRTEGRTDRPTSDPSGQLAQILDASALSLAREIAQDIRDLEDILHSYGFSGSGDPRWLALKDSASFDAALRSMILEWQAADSTSRRVRVKASAATEVLLAPMAALAADPSAGASARVDAAKWIAGLAGFRDGPAVDGTGPTFSLTINMGDRQVRVSSGGAILDHVEDDTQGAGSVGAGSVDTESVGAQTEETR
jgi:hypothetical protein